MRAGGSKRAAGRCPGCVAGRCRALPARAAVGPLPRRLLTRRAGPRLDAAAPAQCQRRLGPCPRSPPPPQIASAGGALARGAADGMALVVRCSEFNLMALPGTVPYVAGKGRSRTCSSMPQGATLRRATLTRPCKCRQHTAAASPLRPRAAPRAATRTAHRASAAPQRLGRE